MSGGTKMKKRIIKNSAFYILILLFAGCRVNSGDINPAGASFIDETVTVNFSVTEPELSQVYNPGDEVVIKWSTDISNPRVDILLFRKGSKILTIAENSGLSDGFYRWIVPDNLPDSHHYRILIQNSVKPVEHAYSDYFYIFRTRD